MRLIDASEDDCRVTQAWGHGFSESAWVSVVRCFHDDVTRWLTLCGTDAWFQRTDLRVLPSLVAGAITHAGGLSTFREGLVGVVGNHRIALSVVTAWLDLAAYDPDEYLRGVLDTGLLQARDPRNAPPDALVGTLVTVLHHSESHRIDELVRRYKSLPLAAVERRSPRGLRADVFTTTDTIGWGEVAGRAVSGCTVLVALHSSADAKA